MKMIHAVLACLLFSMLVTTRSPAHVPTAAMPASPGSHDRSGLIQSRGTDLLETSLAVGEPLTDTLSTVLLPLIPHAYHSPAPCSPASPFSMQIAALHQVTPAAGPDHAAQALVEAEWLARYEEAFPTLVEALAASGACWARVRVDWATIQPDPPPAGYVWGPYHDEKLSLVAKAGVQVIAYIDGVPKWAGDSTHGPIHPDRLHNFVVFLIDLVNRYKQPPYNIHHWELFNEPDWTLQSDELKGWGWHGDRYAQMLEMAYTVIKAADPEATVLMGGLAYDWFTEYGGPFYRYFPDEVMAAGGGDHLDVLNFHYFPDFRHEWERWDPNSDERRYGWLPAPTCGDLYDDVGTAYEAGGVDLIAKASHFRNRLSTCFGVDKPFWVTELGEHGYADDPQSLAQQARYVIQGHARGLAAGAGNITWFVLVSPPYDPHAQGLLYEDDWTPKPAFYAYQTLTSELAGYAYARTLDAPDVEGYVFRDAQQREKTVAWWALEWPPSGSLLLAPAASVRVVDRDRNVTLIEDGGPGDLDGAYDGVVKLQMTAEPVFLTIKEPAGDG